MITEAVKEWNEEDIVEVKDQPLDHRNMFVLAVATSIDALAVGITFAFRTHRFLRQLRSSELRQWLFLLLV